MSSRVLYNLAGAKDDRRYSHYCWRRRMALAHKGLPVKAILWRFSGWRGTCAAEPGPGAP
jgi:hypothetical protein